MNNPLMYSDPSGEFFFAATPFIVYILLGVKAALIGAAIGAGLFIAKGLMTNNWSGFGKSILMGALTGVVSGGLGQVFSASGFWATVGNGALAGAGSGGITSIINGTNFLEGLAKGAVIGGAMAAVSYTINYLVKYSGMKNEFKYSNGESSGSGQSQEYSNKTLKTMRKANFTPEEIRQYKVGRDLIGSENYAQDSNGYFITGNTSKALAYTTRPNFFSGLSDIHYARAAFASKELLFTTMVHETAHSYIMYAGNFFIKQYDKIGLFNRGYDTPLNNLGHAAIYDSENYLSALNNFPINPAIGYDKDFILNAVNNNYSGNQTEGFNILKRFILPVFSRKMK